MAVTEETEAKVRADREAAIEYAERVLAGEEPWKDDEEAGEVPAPDIDQEEIDEAVVEPRNDDVGENGEDDSDAVIEVDQDNPAPEPTE